MVPSRGVFKNDGVLDGETVVGQLLVVDPGADGVGVGEHVLEAEVGGVRYLARLQNLLPGVETLVAVAHHEGAHVGDDA